MSRDRFTEKNENEKWQIDVTAYHPPFYVVTNTHFQAIEGLGRIEKTYLSGPAIDRLAEYEDLIFSPEVLQAIIKEWKEWADAKNEGRLIVLPVVEGTPLFVDGALFASHCKGEIHVVRDWYYSNPMIYKDFRGEHDYAIDPESIGESVFLTREEAEKALKK